MAPRTNRKPKTPANPVINTELATQVKQTLHLKDNPVARLPQAVQDTLSTHRPEGAIDLGSTAFDAIEGLSSVGQITAFRAIANGAICGAVFAAHRYLTTDDEDTSNASRATMALQSQVYNHCTHELKVREVKSFDLPMDLDAAYTFAATSARDSSMPTELPANVLAIIGRTKEQVAQLDALAAKNQSARDAKLRDAIKVNERGIKDELKSYLGDRAPFTLTNGLNVAQHAALFQKVSRALGKAIDRLVQNRDRYDGAMSDMVLLAADIPLLDNHYKSFRRRNAGDEHLARSEAAAA